MINSKFFLIDFSQPSLYTSIFFIILCPILYNLLEVLHLQPIIVLNVFNHFQMIYPNFQVYAIHLWFDIFLFLINWYCHLYLKSILTSFLQKVFLARFFVDLPFTFIKFVFFFQSLLWKENHFQTLHLDVSLYNAS